MINRYLFIAISLTMLLACASRKELYKEEQKASLRPDVQSLQMKKADETLYWGEGIATIGGDIGAAREQAKERALHDLSQKIQVNVEADISQVIQSNMSASSEDIRELFTQKVRTYTQSALTNTRDLFVVDYPASGNCTFLVFMSRAEYQRKVNEDLKMKKSAVRNAVENGDAAMKHSDFMLAANHWANARDHLNNFFGDLPLQDDLDKNGKNEEVHAYLQQKMGNLFGNIELSFLPDEISYDAAGTLSKKPIVQAKYEDANGRTQSIANLPLKVEFTGGKGRVSGNVITDNYGTAKLALTVDASNPQTSIAVQIDKNAVDGLADFNLPRLAEAKMTFEKIKTIAIAVSFKNQSKRSTPDVLLNEIKNILLAKGFLTVDFSTASSRVTSTDLTRASTSNADYLLVVSLRSAGGGTVGGYSNMFASTVSGFVSLYKLPRGEQIATDQVHAAKGFGVSASVAGWDAYGKVKNKAMEIARRIIESAL